MPLKILKICLFLTFTLSFVYFIFNKVLYNFFGIYILLLLIITIIAFIVFEIDKKLHPHKYIGYTENNKEQSTNKIIEEKKNNLDINVSSVNNILKDEKRLLTTEKINKEVNDEAEKRLKESHNGKINSYLLKGTLLSLIFLAVILLYTIITELVKF